jgi:hypothetical protein
VEAQCGHHPPYFKGHSYRLSVGGVGYRARPKAFRKYFRRSRWWWTDPPSWHDIDQAWAVATARALDDFVRGEDEGAS